MNSDQAKKTLNEHLIQLPIYFQYVNFEDFEVNRVNLKLRIEVSEKNGFKTIIGDFYKPINSLVDYEVFFNLK
jgi:hypothetical protein